MINTYIIKTIDGEYYCGKTTNINKRMDEHNREKKPHWFAYKGRKDYMLKYIIEGDYEKKIKKFGIKHFSKILDKR